MCWHAPIIRVRSRRSEISSAAPVTRRQRPFLTVVDDPPLLLRVIRLAGPLDRLLATRGRGVADGQACATVPVQQLVHVVDVGGGQVHCWSVWPALQVHTIAVLAVTVASFREAARLGERRDGVEPELEAP